MLQIIIRKTVQFYNSKNRWWLPLVCGILFSLCLPPFNHEFHPLFSLFPFLNFVVLIPLLGFASQKSFRRAAFHTYLFSFAASLSQYYWIAFDKAEGLWHLILIGLVLICAVVGIFYLIAGLLFRVIYKKLPRFYILFYPMVWVLIDYGRSLGDISFPWGFLGYSLTPLLPLAQIASVTGVWGLTFLILLGNMLFWELGICYYEGNNRFQKTIHIAVFALVLILISVWGGSRMKKEPLDSDTATVSLLQSNLDQLSWGKNSLDSAFNITENLFYQASRKSPDLMIGPESALLCYIDKQPSLRNRVLSWTSSTGIPFVFGSLQWNKAPDESYYDYHVYNTAFLVKPNESFLESYFKIKLVPFSEAIPFEGLFPLLSRVNLGEADFQRGTDYTVYSIDKMKAAPFICYEIIYPGFVQKRLKNGANLIVNITNDGWFGKSSGPFQHATMSRLRSIENGVQMVRCANSGISMHVDHFGRVIEKTGLYERTVLTSTCLLKSPNTFYSKWRDWIIYLFAIVTVCTSVRVTVKSKFRKPEKN